MAQTLADSVGPSATLQQPVRADSSASAASTPQTGPPDAKLAQDGSKQRQAEADNIVVITLDPADEWTAETVNGESAGDVERFSCADVCLDILIGEVGEVHQRRGDCRSSGRCCAFVEHHMVTGMQQPK